MKVGLFIPCYIDAFFPEVGVATLELLERLGSAVEYPLDQTCCGQPMANSGCQDDAAATEAHFVHCFQDFDAVVGPSGSCVHHVRFHLDAIEQTPQAQKVRACDPRARRVPARRPEGRGLSGGRRFRTRWGCTTVAPPSGVWQRGRRSGSTNPASEDPGLAG